MLPQQDCTCLCRQIHGQSFYILTASAVFSREQQTYTRPGLRIIELLIHFLKLT